MSIDDRLEKKLNNLSGPMTGEIVVREWILFQSEIGSALLRTESRCASQKR